MIDLFLGYAAEKIAEARAAQSAGDLPGVAKAVHPIKSSAGNVGAGRVQDVAQRIETLANQGQAETLGALVGELEASFAVVKPELEQKKQSLASQSS